MSRDEHAILLAAGCSRRMGELTRELPKSLLPVGGRRLIEYALDALDQRGIQQATLVVGYRQEVIRRALGHSHGGLRLDYVASADYETTGHGWSLFQVRDAWRASGRPMLLLHADTFFHPAVLDRVLDARWPNVVAVDEGFEVRTGDEVVVLGREGRVDGFAKGVSRETPGLAGELIGANRWSPDWLEALFEFMASYFRQHGPNHNYEPVLNSFLSHQPAALHYVPSGGLPWMNMNYPEDYALVRDVLWPSVFGGLSDRR